MKKGCGSHCTPYFSHFTVGLCNCSEQRLPELALRDQPSRGCRAYLLIYLLTYKRTLTVRNNLLYRPRVNNSGPRHSQESPRPPRTRVTTLGHVGG